MVTGWIVFSILVVVVIFLIQDIIKNIAELEKDRKSYKSKKIDPVCLLHGKKWSEHKLGFCLYCCLCFKPLTPEECNVREDGRKEDVCKLCAAKEKQAMRKNDG